jgi:putative transposase
MARPLRIEFEGALHHITSRGNAGAKIFFIESDRQAFLDILGEVVNRYGCRMGGQAFIFESEGGPGT